MDPMDPGGPLWWLVRLERRLRWRNARTAIYDDYYSGRHRLAFATPKFREAFGGLFNELADDWCGLVVDAVDERMTVTGFRIGSDAERGDQDAQRIWQANSLDAGSRMGHVEALVREEAAAIVWFPDDTSFGEPKITVESPEQVFVEFTDSSRTSRAAALKLWLDDDGYEYATVYLPDGLYKYRSKQTVMNPSSRDMLQATTERPSGGGGAVALPSLVNLTSRSGTWEPREIRGESWPVKNKLGLVPVVPLTNRPRLGKDGESELRRVIPVQDAVNKLIADMLVASEYQAFRQRWATGIDIPRNPDTNEPIDDFKSAASRVWTSKNDAAKFGDFGTADLENFVKAIEMFVQHVASQTRTPPHYFYLSGNFPSGESIKSAETGLVSKARSKMLHFGEGWEEVIRLAFKTKDDPRADDPTYETIWRDPESRTESEHIDATLKKLALGVPQEQLWEDAGYSPTQIERFKKMLREQHAEQMATAMMGTLNGGTQPTNGAPPGGTTPETVPGAPVQPQVLPERFRL